MIKEIPLLSAADVELRTAQIQQTNHGTYATLLVYKNARVDMRILDEVFGPLNWSRNHFVIDGRLFCTISLWDEDKQQWVQKTDVGIPSNSDATKGECSDAFKRSAFNVGIGRCLYDAPDIKIRLADSEVTTGSNGKPKTYAKFYVGDMVYDKELGRFTRFTVLDRNGNIRFDINGNKQVQTKSAASTEHPQAATQPAESARPPFAVSKCCECSTPIKSQKVVDYAMSRFGKVICYECQKKGIA